jgi:hypothetical protein
MATTTPNNGWAVPTSTDYVKDGATAIETLGDAIDTSVGTGLLAWTAYTPTFTNFTLGNGTIDFAYAQLGKTVNVRGRVILGSTSVIGSSPQFSTPVTAAAAGGRPNVGHAKYTDTGAATYPGGVLLLSTTNFQLIVFLASGTYAQSTAPSATVPFTWITTDEWLVNITYEAA